MTTAIHDHMCVHNDSPTPDYPHRLRLARRDGSCAMAARCGRAVRRRRNPLSRFFLKLVVSRKCATFSTNIRCIAKKLWATIICSCSSRSVNTDLRSSGLRLCWRTTTTSSRLILSTPMPWTPSRTLSGLAALRTGPGIPRAFPTRTISVASMRWSSPSRTMTVAIPKTSPRPISCFIGVSRSSKTPFPSIT